MGNAAVALLLAGACARGAAPAGFVHASGTLIVDGGGRELKLRGVNLGGWLQWESYILRYPGKDVTESRIKRELVARHGREAAYAFFRAYRDRYVTREDLRRIRALGWNVVRVPFNSRLLDRGGHFDMTADDGWAVLDRLLGWCEEAGVYAVLDMHSAPGGQNGGGISDTDLKRGLFAGDSTTRYREDMTALWGRIASRYRGRTIVAAYDLMNEPAVPDAEGGAEAVAAVYARVVPAVRAADPRHLIMVEGNWYATDFHAFRPPPLDANLCYQIHKYWNETTPGSIRVYLDLRERMRAPVWLGETGENSADWYARCVALMEANAIGWCFWPWKRAGRGCVAGFEPPARWWETAAGLKALAAGVALDRCREDPDVLRALDAGRALRHDGPP